MRVAFLGTDSEGGTFNDAMQDALSHHPLVSHVDFEWTSPRWGKEVVPAVGKDYIYQNLSSYDLIFMDHHRPQDTTVTVESLLDAQNLWKRVIIYDVCDPSEFRFDQSRIGKCLLYLKRAWADDCIPKQYNNIIPIDTSLLDAYLDVVPVDYYHYRDLTVTCTLPQAMRGNARDRIVDYVKYHHWPRLPGMVGFTQVTLFYTSGWVMSSAAINYRFPRNYPDPQMNWWYVYMHMLRRTQILFTGMTHGAPGDHRMWEAFSSKALIVTDRVRSDMPNPPIAGKHFIPFDLNDPEKSLKEAEELLVDTKTREAIAQAGFDHACKYHSSKARVEYIMNEIVRRQNGANSQRPA